MLATPTSSPQMMRILGLLPEGAVGAAGVAFCVCASAPEVIVAAATSADEPSRMLRRLRARSLVSFIGASCRSCSLVSSGIFHSHFTSRTDDYLFRGWCPLHAAETDMARRSIDRFGMARRRAIAPAIVRRAQMRAALQYFAGNLDVRQRRVVARAL